MNILYIALSLINKVTRFQIVSAHCDIPCGIYTLEPAKTAADTVIKMVEKIQALDQNAGDLETRNSFVRMVAVKEAHAQKCKEELLILWTDYFKAEHLVMFPSIHDVFWKAAKLCSKNKQHVDMEAARELRQAVEEIAEMFIQAEEAKKIK
jgi:nickel superoxide dismutase